MSMTARISRGLGAALLTGGVLLAAAPGAMAAAPPTPDAPTILDATVSGCQAPCAPGEAGVVHLVIKQPSNGGTAFAYADGVQVDWQAVGGGSPTLDLYLNVCSAVRAPFEGCITQQRVDALRGGETMTVKAHACTGDPDMGTLECSPLSKSSNGVVPRQI